jgi:hemerythrin-like domain-containing protein
MKREPALHSLSHEHHRALGAAMKLRRAGEEVDASEAAAAFRDFWASEGRRHFRAEDEVLLPRFARYGDPTDPAVVRVLTEHVAIRRRAADLESGEESAEALRELGELLDGHVRHEERVLFPMVERAMPADALAELGEALERGPAE